MDWSVLDQAARRPSPLVFLVIVVAYCAIETAVMEGPFSDDTKETLHWMFFRSRFSSTRPGEQEARAARLAELTETSFSASLERSDGGCTLRVRNDGSRPAFHVALDLPDHPGLLRETDAERLASVASVQPGERLEAELGPLAVGRRIEARVRWQNAAGREHTAYPAASI